MLSHTVIDMITIRCCHYWTMMFDRCPASRDARGIIERQTGCHRMTCVVSSGDRWVLSRQVGVIGEHEGVINRWGVSSRDRWVVIGRQVGVIGRQTGYHRETSEVSSEYRGGGVLPGDKWSVIES